MNVLNVLELIANYLCVKLRCECKLLGGFITGRHGTIEELAAVEELEWQCVVAQGGVCVCSYELEATHSILEVLLLKLIHNLCEDTAFV